MIDRALGFNAGTESPALRHDGGAPRKRGVDEMMGMRGLSRGRDRGVLNSYLASAGERLDVGVSAWCAAYVNASLERQGIRGDGSEVATDFANWGQAVAVGQAQKGDVLVKMRGHRPGETDAAMSAARNRPRIATRASSR